VQAHRLSAILGLVIVYWVSEALPLPVTALLGVVLCVLLGVAEATEALSSFADPIISLFIGSFILAEGMVIHGLDRRFALRILSLRWVGEHPVRLLFAFGGIAVLLSMWISNTATAAMMLPIGLGILRTLRDTTSLQQETSVRSYQAGMMLMIAYAASVGGIGTPVGSPPNLIGIGLIDKLLGVRITFFEWMLLMMPMMLVMYLFLFLLLARLHPQAVRRFVGLQDDLQRHVTELGRWTPGQRNCLLAFSVAVLLWILSGVIGLIYGSGSDLYRMYTTRIHEGVVALIAAVLLFLLPTDWKRWECTLTWEQAVRIDWGTILFFGGGLSLGKLMFSTGLASVIGRGVMTLSGVTSLWGITAVAILLGIIISETTSNTASANMVIPVVIALAQAAGVSGLPPALGACLGASYGFMLPVSTPPNAIVYSSRLVPILSMVRAGILFDLFGGCLIWCGLRLLCPLVGLM
jgi:sodium-dependent dicarboxylate transporter 2/3/5